MAPTGNKPKHPGKAVAAGGIAGAIEICCTYPLEYTKTVAQLSTEGGGAMAVVRNTLKEYGPLGFYRGLSSMVYFATPKAAIRFSAFESANNALTKDGKGMFGGMTGFVAGLVAGTLEAIFVTTPQETIKIKLIDDAFKREVPRFNGFFHGVSTIIKEEGFAGVYAGVAPTVLKVATAQATEVLGREHANDHRSPGQCGRHQRPQRRGRRRSSSRRKLGRARHGSKPGKYRAGTSRRGWQAAKRCSGASHFDRLVECP